MGNITENVASNISRLRKSFKMTQSEMAIKLNYSDKAISKWERGESLPDIEVLATISKLFNVSLDYLIEEHDDSEIYNKDQESKRSFLREILVLTLWCVAAFSVATIIFIYVYLARIPNAYEFWVSFVCAAAISALFVLRYARKNKYELTTLIAGSLSSWLVITSAFCITFVLEMNNVWMLFLIGLPIQAALFISYFMKKTK